VLLLWCLNTTQIRRKQVVVSVLKYKSASTYSLWIKSATFKCHQFRSLTAVVTIAAAVTIIVEVVAVTKSTVTVTVIQILYIILLIVRVLLVCCCCVVQRMCNAFCNVRMRDYIAVCVHLTWCLRVVSDHIATHYET
jgi:ABC-type polysaccharide/polyol phosphate export permease